MSSEEQKYLPEIVESFQTKGQLDSIAAFNVGHINKTWVSTRKVGDLRVRYLHQLINHHVFRDVPGLMGNVELVTKHLEARYAHEQGEDRVRTLKIIPTKTGETFVKDPAGEYWRTYDFVEDSQSFDVCKGADQARECAAMFGRFLADLSDIPVSNLIATIPFFQNVPNRLRQLEEAVEQNKSGRVQSVAKEIDFSLSRKAKAAVVEEGLKSGKIPLRVTHSDPKFNNVLFHSKTGRAVCIVDLDTCMPGTMLYDFGDMVRNAAVPAAEDELDLSKVYTDENTFETLVEGYLRHTVGLLTSEELSLMAVAPRLLALSLGTRFLADHINGDIYFRIERPGQNLDRARTQFKIVEDMEARQDRMSAIVEKHAKNALSQRGA